MYTDYLIIVIFFDINISENDIDFSASVFELNLYVRLRDWPEVHLNIHVFRNEKKSLKTE